MTISKTLRNLLAEIDAALATERRPTILRRLRAVKLMLNGVPIAECARRLGRGTPKKTAQGWWDAARREGLPGLIRDGRAERQEIRIAPKSAGDLRASIRAALKRPRAAAERRRLQAVNEVLQGRTVRKVAAQAGISAKTLRVWLVKLKDRGVAALLAESKRWSRVDITPKALNTLAQAEPDEAAARRLRALALIAEGKPAQEVAAEVGAAPASVSQWIKRFREQGATALLSGSRRVIKIDADREMLHALAKAEPDEAARKRLRALVLIAEGKPAHMAAAEVGAARSSVARWIKRFRERGLDGLHYKDGKAGPRSLKERARLAIEEAIRQAPRISDKRLCKLMHDQFGLRFQPVGMRRLLKETLGLTRKGGKLVSR